MLDPSKDEEQENIEEGSSDENSSDDDSNDGDSGDGGEDDDEHDDEESGANIEAQDGACARFCANVSHFTCASSVFVLSHSLRMEWDLVLALRAKLALSRLYLKFDNKRKHQRVFATTLFLSRINFHRNC